MEKNSLEKIVLEEKKDVEYLKFVRKWLASKKWIRE